MRYSPDISVETCSLPLWGAAPSSAAPALFRRVMRRWHVCRMQPVRVQAEGLAHRLPRGGARPATTSLPRTFSPSPIPPQGDCGTLRWAQAFFLLAAAYAICYLLFISGILDSRDGGQVKNWTGGNFANCCTYSSECNHHLPAPVPPKLCAHGVMMCGVPCLMLLGLIAVASQDRSEFDGMPEQGYVRPPPRRNALWPNRIEKQKQQSWPRRRVAVLTRRMWWCRADCFGSA